MRSNRRSSRGFTLIELMMVVAIIGILASIAIPEFRMMSLRARIAEREAIMRAIAKSVEDVSLNSGGLGAFVGAYNPDASPGTTKRPWVQSGPGWNVLPLIVDGGTYCSYKFELAPGTPDLLAVTGDCDIDGDGNHNTKVDVYEGLGHAFVLRPDLSFETTAAGVY